MHRSSLLLIKCCVFPPDSQQLKRKNEKEDSEVESSELVGSLRLTNISNSPFHTPVSAKGGRANNRSNATKGNRSTPPMPMLNAGEKMCYNSGCLLSYLPLWTWESTVLSP